MPPRTVALTCLARTLVGQASRSAETQLLVTSSTERQATFAPLHCTNQGFQRVPTSLFKAAPSSGVLLNQSPEQLSSHRGLFTSFGRQPEPKKYQQRRLVGWTPDQFYQVVSDVDQYRQFVPWCQKSQVVRRQGGGYMEAELEVGFQMLVERYTSKIRLEAPRVVSSHVSNSLLFHHLDSSWVMEAGPSPDTCWLTFKVDFAFNSVLYGNLADLFFSEVVKQMVHAFEGRCTRLYGPSSLLRPHRAKPVGGGSRGSSGHAPPLTGAPSGAAGPAAAAAPKPVQGLEPDTALSRKTHPR